MNLTKKKLWVTGWVGSSQDGSGFRTIMTDVIALRVRSGQEGSGFVLSLVVSNRILSVFLCRIIHFFGFQVISNWVLSCLIAVQLGFGLSLVGSSQVSG